MSERQLTLDLKGSDAGELHEGRSSLHLVRVSAKLKFFLMMIVLWCRPQALFARPERRRNLWSVSKYSGRDEEYSTAELLERDPELLHVCHHAAVAGPA